MALSDRTAFFLLRSVRLSQIRDLNLKRWLDISASICLLMIFSIPMVLLALAIRLTSEGPALYWSDRVGLNNTIFRMPKFRTMQVDTPALATHLLASPEKHMTPLGKVLRKYSLDELPQLYSVLKGDMSFVGPRPALYNQDDLIQLRTEKGVHRLVPGITGWAQVNGRDNLPIPAKVDLDEFYLNGRSVTLDLKILFMTVFSVAGSKGVTH
jgi:O-antigen biosynthesis protein WbqP